MKTWKKQWLEAVLCLSLGVATATASYLNKPNWLEQGINWVIDNIILFHWSSTPANNGGAYGTGGGDAW
jgi:hypothetical protein